jgi:hypothetical protein
MEKGEDGLRRSSRRQQRASERRAAAGPLVKLDLEINMYIASHNHISFKRRSLCWTLVLALDLALILLIQASTPPVLGIGFSTTFFLLR